VSPLTDGEALELVKNKKISPYLLEELLDDPTRAVKIRRLFYEHETKNEGIEDVPYLSYDYNKVKKKKKMSLLSTGAFRL
jgi:hypothetical protein